MNKEYDIPELIDLPVFREDYISQSQVDFLCKLIWNEKGDIVRQLAQEINVPFVDRGNVNIPRKMSHIITFLRDEERKRKIAPLSMIGMVDLTYEILRRISISLGAGDVPIRGEQISPSPDGPFPPIGEVYNYIWGEKNDPPKKYSLKKENLYLKLYKEHPEIIFSATELERRALRMGEPHWFLDNYFNENLPEEDFRLCE